MRGLEEQLAGYAAYHRCRRNLASHFVGIPLIVLGAGTLLARPAIEVGAMVFSPAVGVTLVAVIFYWALDARFALALTVLMGSNLLFASKMAEASTAVWLPTGLALFVVGWAIQGIGHVMEGRKPAFVDDLVGLLLGPLFIVAELGFALGLRRELHQAIERSAGPTRP